MHPNKKIEKPKIKLYLLINITNIYECLKDLNDELKIYYSTNTYIFEISKMATKQ